jgi:sulfite reductase (NADPH) flavoprotein alpha-component
LADRIAEDSTLPVFIDVNKTFRLPENNDTPIIMVGPGTGIAPFRAFIQEREADGATGKNWLFFGDQHFHTDFLYQTEWQKYLKQGLLTRMDVAFSRDQSDKIYVQHRLLERSKDLYAWLQEGASIYVCGDMGHMATDVYNTFITIAEQQGGMSNDAAKDYVRSLQKAKRYQEDVY